MPRIDMSLMVSSALSTLYAVVISADLIDGGGATYIKGNIFISYHTSGLGEQTDQLHRKQTNSTHVGFIHLTLFPINYILSFLIHLNKPIH